MTTAVVLFTRDLRVGDNPALASAAEQADRVIPLFVVDDAVLGSDFGGPNRVHFLVDCLHDLRASLRARGGDLVVRRGDPVEEVLSLCREHAAHEVHVAADVSRFAHEREQRLARDCEEQGVALTVHPGPTVIEPGAVTPVGGDHYRVFTPYWRAWRAAPWRAVTPDPSTLRLPAGLTDEGVIPRAEDLVGGDPSPDRARGGESRARALLAQWAGSTLSEYEGIHDDLAGDRTSRLSPYVHLGCVSALELATELQGRAGGEGFVRQLCWRDFHHQVTAAFPDIATEEYRSRGDRWRGAGRELDAWRDGRTGYPIVDAGMRQLRREGWMHNRARLITASFLTKDLYVDWRLGAAHFLYWLVDGDLANNSGNWQWIAGTGNDTRPNRVLNPLRQAERFDPDGDYVRRYVPELAEVAGPAVHRPWELGDLERSVLDYPERIVDHEAAAAAFRDRRG